MLYVTHQKILEEIITQGTPAYASRVRLTLQDVDEYATEQDAGRHFAVRAMVADQYTLPNSAAGTGYATNATMALVTRKGVQITEHTATKDLTWATYPGQKNVDTLTIGGVVKDEEYLTIGSRVYEFDSGYGLGECTITIAAPGVVTCTGHGLVTGNVVSFKTSGALPTGLTANTLYYVLASGLTADAFKVAATLNGTAITTTGTQSGIHTLKKQTFTSGRVPVSIGAYVTAQSDTLTVDTNPSIGDTMTVGTRTYAFVATGTANNAGEIAVGSDLATTQAAIVAAINGTDGWNVQNPLASCGAFATDIATIRARTAGAEAQIGAIATTETFAASARAFPALLRMP